MSTKSFVGRLSWLVGTVLAALVSFLGTAQGSEAELVDEEVVVNLVDKTAGDVAGDATTTLEKIKDGKQPYKSKSNPALYVCIYDTNVTLIADPDKSKSDINYKGKNFHTDMVLRAMENALDKKDGGWIEYSDTKPGAVGRHHKKTYFKYVLGSDKKKYIVCSGIYTK